jgi:hypothetical protein
MDFCAGPSAAVIPGVVGAFKLKTPTDAFGASVAGWNKNFLIIGASNARTTWGATCGATWFSDAGCTLLSKMFSCTGAMWISSRGIDVRTGASRAGGVTDDCGGSGTVAATGAGEANQLASGAFGNFGAHSSCSRIAGLAAEVVFDFVSSPGFGAGLTSAPLPMMVSSNAGKGEAEAFAAGAGADATKAESLVAKAASSEASGADAVTVRANADGGPLGEPAFYRVWSKEQRQNLVTSGATAKI